MSDVDGPDDFVAVNARYPEGWSIEVRTVVATGTRVASEVHVPHVDLGTFAAASFWTVEDGRVTRGVEYWTTLGGDPRPAWRESLTRPWTT